MQHVDDALLIAYADGALDGADRQIVDEHLTACAECRARVEEERALARHAHEVLSGAAPVVSAVPPFEDVLRRGAPRSPRARSAWVPLAWAASLVVAIGAGWMANELLLSPAMEQPVESAVARDAAVRGAAESEAAESETAEAVDDVAREELASSSAAAPAAATQERTESRPAAPPPVAQLGAAEGDAAQKSALSARASAPAPAAAPAPAEPTRSRAERGVAASVAANAVVTMELDAADIAWRGSGAADAPDSGAPVRGVPDVAIDSVWLAHDSADWRVRVLHRLEQGPLEVIEWRRAPWQGVVASGTLPDGRRYLLGRSDSVLVELRARLDADSLTAFLARIRPLR